MPEGPAEPRPGAAPEGLGNVVLPAVSEGILHVAHDGRVTYANPAACRLLGYAEGDLVGQPEHALLHKARADGSPFPAERCPIHGTLRDAGVHHSYGELFWRADGTSFPVEYTSAPLRDAEGRVGAVVVFTDNSERSRALEIERKAQQKVQRVYDGVPDAFVMLDRDWRVTYVNAAAQRLPQPLDEGPLLGRSLWEAFPELRGTPIEEAYVRAMRDRVPVRVETLHERSGLWFEAAAYPSDEGLSVYLRDVTARKRAEAEARAASIARPLARQIVQDLVETGNVPHQILTQVGRNLAAGTEGATLDGFVSAFEEMGLGSIHLEKAEGQRYSFGGSDLLEKRPGSRTTTCSFTLGFLSEIVSRIHNHEPTLGTEIECQSRGAAECRFVVQVKKPEEGLARRVKELV